MIRILSKFILNKIIGWKVIGYLPTKEKYVIAVVPHSSYFDLIIAVLIRTYSGLKIKFIGKKELFNPITSFLFKYLGGIPVDRTKKLNIVDEIVGLFKSGKIKILAISSEKDLQIVIKNKFIPFKKSSIPISIDNICFLLKSMNIPMLLINKDV